MAGGIAGRPSGPKALAALLVAAALPAASGAEARVLVRIRARAEVAPGLVRLGDVASVAGDDPALERRVRSVLLGRAPAEGDVRTIPRAHAESRLRREGLPASLVRVTGEPFAAVSLPGEAGAAEAVPAPRTTYAVEARPGAEPRPRGYVLAGETVEVSAGTPRLRITDRARAETPGAIGDVIVVRNMRSGGTYRARVTGAGRVQVEP